MCCVFGRLVSLLLIGGERSSSTLVFFCLATAFMTTVKREWIVEYPSDCHQASPVPRWLCVLQIAVRHQRFHGGSVSCVPSRRRSSSCDVVAHNRRL